MRYELLATFALRLLAGLGGLSRCSNTFRFRPIVLAIPRTMSLAEIVFSGNDNGPTQPRFCHHVVITFLSIEGTAMLLAYLNQLGPVNGSHDCPRDGVLQCMLESLLLYTLAA